MLLGMPQDFLADLAARYSLSEADRQRLSAMLPVRPPSAPEPTQYLPLTDAPDEEPPAPPEELPSPRSAPLHDPGGRYQAMAVLGRGGMGEVHRVWDRVLERPVAMKVILPMRSGRSTAIARFEQEARLAARLQHPGIVGIYDLGRLPDGRLYITMEEVRGEPLARVLQQRRSPRHRLRLLADTAETIAYAHSHGVLHRDIKPSNIMVVGFDDIKIVDWGLASRLPGSPRIGPPAAEPSSRLSSLSTYPGTPAYMAPELLSDGVPSEAADVYALGVILYRSLSEQLPFPEAGFSAHLQRVRDGRSEPPSLPQTTPGPLAALCRSTLSPRPEERPSAAKLAEALKSYLNGESQREAALALVEEAEAILEELEDLQICAEDLKAQGRAELKDVAQWQPTSLKQPGWRSLDQARSLRQDVWRQEIRYLKRLQQALVMSPGLPEAHDQLAAWHRARHAEAEAAGEDEARIRAAALLAAHDRGAHRAYRIGDGALTLVTEPPGATLTLLRYAEVNRRLVAQSLPDTLLTPLHNHPLAMGSYLLLIEHPDCEPVRYPVCIRRQARWHGIRPGEAAPAPVRLPPRGSLSDDEVLIPAGWFTRGSDPTTNARHRDNIWVDGVIFRRFPVTVAEYQAFQTALGEPLCSGISDHPVCGVTWEDASRYCAWIRAQTGEPWRLPGEWEWEKAARGVDGRHYPWGWFGDDAWAATRHSHPDDLPAPAPVTAFPTDVSVYGVRGVGGGVQQWCGDDNIWGSPVACEIALLPDPTSPRRERLIRGGSWNHYIKHSRCSWRHFDYRDEAEVSVGFRLVRSLPG